VLREELEGDSGGGSEGDVVLVIGMGSGVERRA
jgi:hypothetical protein